MARYPGEMTDENIRKIFDGAGDFNYRPLQCGAFTLYSYAIDGLTAGSAASEYIFKPITDHLRADSGRTACKNFMIELCPAWSITLWPRPARIWTQLR